MAVIKHRCATDLTGVTPARRLRRSVERAAVTCIVSCPGSDGSKNLGRHLREGVKHRGVEAIDVCLRPARACRLRLRWRPRDAVEINNNAATSWRLTPGRRENITSPSRAPSCLRSSVGVNVLSPDHFASSKRSSKSFS